MNFEYKVEGGDFTNAGSTSSIVKKMMKQLGVHPDIVKRTVVALYEAEVNIVAHANRGVIYVDLDENKVYIKLEDEGKGIPDIDVLANCWLRNTDISSTPLPCWARVRTRCRLKSTAHAKPSTSCASTLISPPKFIPSSLFLTTLP